MIVNRSKLSLALGCSFALLTWMAYRVFDNHAFCSDEYNFLFQATLFSKGTATIPVAGLPDSLRDMYMVWHNGLGFSKYPPGFPLVLRFGVSVGLAGLINPLISVGTLLICFLAARRLVGETEAFVALLIIATNTYFIGYGASYYSQPLSLFLAAAAFYLLVRWQTSTAWTELIGMGTVVGYSILTRPLDGFCLFIPITVGILLEIRHRDRKWKILYFMAPIAALILFFMTYNWIISGRFGLSTYDILDLEFRLVDSRATSPWANAVSIAREYIRGIRLEMMLLLRRYYVGRMGLFVTALAIVGVWSTRRTLWSRLLALHVFLLIALYNFHHTLGWPQYGARYYYPTIVALFLWCAAGANGLATYFSAVLSGKKARYELGAALLVVCAVQLAVHREWVAIYRKRFEMVRRLNENIARTCPENAIVVLDPAKWDKTKVPRYVLWQDLKRNYLRKDKRNIIFKTENLNAIRALDPSRPVCIYDFSGDMPDTGGGPDDI